MPQDVGTFAYDYPAEMFLPRAWHIARNRPDTRAIERAAAAIRQARRPLILCGGGARYSQAEEAIARFAEQTGIPVADDPVRQGHAELMSTRSASAERASPEPRAPTRWPRPPT